VRESADLKQMMVQVLNMGDYFVIEWDFKSNMLRNKYGKLLPDEGMRPEEFLKHMPHDEAERLHTFNSQLAMGTLDHFDMHLSFNNGTAEQPNWRSYYGSGIVEKHHGKPQYIVYTIKDTTDEVNEERLIKNDMNKYKQMFDTNLIAMSFYNADGVLLDINKKMRELCEITDVYDLYFQKSILFSFPNLKGVYMPGSREVMYVCQHLNEPLLGINKYIEFRVRPVINDDDELVYYIVTSRDITAERNMYLEQRKHDQRLQTINDTIKHYEIQLSYLLEESLMYIRSYRPAENVINITRTPGKTEFTETIEDYIETIRPDARQQAMTEVQSAMQQGKSYTVILPFDRTPLDKEPTWYSVSGIPIFNKDGQLVEYFGLSRNITSLMEAQEKLRVETARAEDSGRLKAAFLANMTHEIRTPLNAIVGFSDLLPMVEDAADKQEFMRIIRNNCDMLLRLINDILEASNIESRPLAIEPADVDFAQAFDDICQTLEQRVQEPGVLFIKDNPYSTFNAYLDKGRIQQVITNFVINATKYTKEGHIRVGYRREEQQGKQGLYIYCEDTGAGIPKDKQSSVFERFVKLNEYVQGTGLGLSICKSIAKHCNGSIGVSSEGEGHGSTFWLWIPCELQEPPQH
jgi:signal transduction histidine kinase